MSGPDEKRSGDVERGSGEDDRLRYHDPNAATLRDGRGVHEIVAIGDIRLHRYADRCGNAFNEYGVSDRPARSGGAVMSDIKVPKRPTSRYAHLYNRCRRGYAIEARRKKCRCR